MRITFFRGRRKYKTKEAEGVLTLCLEIIIVWNKHIFGRNYAIFFQAIPFNNFFKQTKGPWSMDSWLAYVGDNTQSNTKICLVTLMLVTVAQDDKRWCHNWERYFSFWILINACLCSHQEYKTPNRRWCRWRRSCDPRTTIDGATKNIVRVRTSIYKTESIVRVQTSI
jgi:hypothetical protein